MDRLTMQEAALLARAGGILESGGREARALLAEALEAGRMTAADLLRILQQIEGRAA